MLTNDRMPHQNPSILDERPHAGRRRGVVAIAAAGAVVAASAAGLSGSGTVAAASRIASPEIAAEAGRAVEIYQRWSAEQHPADYIRFVQIRANVAELTAAELGVAADDLDDTWTDAPEPKQVAVLAALSQLGVPYERYESDPDVGFDCSGLTQWAYAQAGVEIERTSRFQYRGAERVDADEADPGDLVYYPGHIAMFLGLDLIVHSPNTGSTVEAGRMFRRSVSYADPLADD